MGQQVADFPNGIVKARIQQSRLGWYASYFKARPDTDLFPIHYDYSQFSFTEKGIRRKAAKTIAMLQAKEERKKQNYIYSG